MLGIHFCTVLAVMVLAAFLVVMSGSITEQVAG
jgi:hypothetical protein